GVAVAWRRDGDLGLVCAAKQRSASSNPPPATGDQLAGGPRTAAITQNAFGDAQIRSLEARLQMLECQHRWATAHLHAVTLATRPEPRPAGRARRPRCCHWAPASLRGARARRLSPPWARWAGPSA